MEEKKDFLPEMTKEIIGNVAKEVNRYVQEVTITKVEGECPFGHKEGEKHLINSTHHSTICGALWQANHACISSFHYGGAITWEKDPTIFKGLCPEGGKVEMQVHTRERQKNERATRFSEWRDMTGKGYPGIDKYRLFLEVFGMEHHCMYGHKAGQRIEIDPFNMGEVCGFLYWNAYHLITLLFSGGNPPWEPDPNIAHGVCPDIYNMVSYRLIREER